MRWLSNQWIKRYILIASAITFIIGYRWIRGAFILSYYAKCKWPPDSLTDIERNGAYEITICIDFTSDAERNSIPKRYIVGDLFHNITQLNKSIANVSISFEELGSLPRHMFKKAKYPEIYKTFPQDVPMKDIVQSIKLGRQVGYIPSYNFPIRILKTSKSVCWPGSRHDLVIVVKSGVYNLEARQEFRDYMQLESKKNPSLSIGYVFSIGVPRSSGGRNFVRDGKIVTLSGPAGEVLEKYSRDQGALMEKIYAEVNQYDDILLADYEDTYFNLSWKTVTNLRWMSAFCSKKDVDFFMIIDDDHRVVVENLEKFRRSKPQEQLRTRLFGKIGYKDEFYRSPKRKYFLSYHEAPFEWASPYPRGMSQLVGADIIDDMAIATIYTKHNYLNEDVYLGMLIQKLGIKAEFIGNFYDHKEYDSRKSVYGAPIVAMKNYLPKP